MALWRKIARFAINIGGASFIVPSIQPNNLNIKWLSNHIKIISEEPFALVEQRGQRVDVLMTDEIACQIGSANLIFNYWAIG